MLSTSYQQPEPTRSNTYLRYLQSHPKSSLPRDPRLRRRRVRKCYATTQSTVPWPMSHMYVQRIFRADNRPPAVAMLHRIRDSFRAALANEGSPFQHCRV